MAQQFHVGLPDRVVPMRVIVGGVNRTGSLSMRVALWQLGFHDCYHMQTVLNNLDTQPQQWVRALEAKYEGKGHFGKAEWDYLLGHSQACCDMPSASFTTDLAEIYPDAKVVILNRDPDEWYESVLHSVAAHAVAPPLMERLVGFYCYCFDGGMRNWGHFLKTQERLVRPYDHATEREKVVSWFKNTYQEFRDHIPADRRLEYHIRDGWKPLCEYLDVPVPTVRDEATGKLVEAPFPRVNDREAFAANWKLMMQRNVKRANSNLLAALGHVALGAAAGYGGWIAWKVVRGWSGRA